MFRSTRTMISFIRMQKMYKYHLQIFTYVTVLNLKYYTFSI